MKTLRKRLSLHTLLLFLLAFYCHSARAQLNNNQFHFRTGFFSASYNGVGVGSQAFSNMMTLNIEYEFFKSTRVSHALRSIIAMDFSSAKLMYFSAGYGQRFYLGGPGMKFFRQEGNISVLSVPKLRYYIGYNVGISQAIIRSINEALQVVSSLLDFGFEGGGSYSITKSVAMDLSTGMSYGWGFSSVAVTGITMHMLLGVNYSF